MDVVSDRASNGGKRVIIAYHHHATTNGVKRVRGDTGTGGDAPSKSKRRQEVALELAGEDDRLDGVVHTKVQTTVDDDTEDRWTETTVETSNAIGGKGLLVDIDESVVLTGTTGLGRLVVIGKASTGVV